MSDLKIRGKAWVGGNDISTYDIIGQNRWTLDNLDPVELGQWAMEGTETDFKNVKNAFKDCGYTFIVAGENFGGGGKSIEHPVIAVKGAGIKAVLADSFDRYNYRNSINNALPVIICEGISKEVNKGDELELDLLKGEVINLKSGNKWTFKPLPDFVIEIMNADGLLNYTKSKNK